MSDLLLKSCFIKEIVQQHDIVRMSKLFKGKIRAHHEPNTHEILRHSAPFLDKSFHTEALLSVGRAAAFATDHAAGIVNVKPFNCMPGTVTTAILNRVRKEHKNMPTLDLVYDGLQETNTQVRLETFMYQARRFSDAANQVR